MQSLKSNFDNLNIKDDKDNNNDDKDDIKVSHLENEDYIDRGRRAFNMYVNSHPNLKLGSWISIVDDNPNTLKIFDTYQLAHKEHGDHDLWFVSQFYGIENPDPIINNIDNSIVSNTINNEHYFNLTESNSDDDENMRKTLHHRKQICLDYILKHPDKVKEGQYITIIDDVSDIKIYDTYERASWDTTIRSQGRTWFCIQHLTKNTQNKLISVKKSDNDLKNLSTNNLSRINNQTKINNVNKKNITKFHKKNNQIDKHLIERDIINNSINELSNTVNRLNNLTKYQLYYGNYLIKAAGILFICYKNNKLNILITEKQKKKQLVWEDFGGKVEQDDKSIYDTVIRETLEETNYIFDQTFLFYKLQQYYSTNFCYNSKGCYGTFIIPINYFNPIILGDKEIYQNINRKCKWITYDIFMCNLSKINARLISDRLIQILKYYN